MVGIMLYSLLSFILIISIIVFVHEFGHYYVAKKCGVKIEQFSIGFGKEILGFNDKSGTRWKFCQIPLGGYVKMFGDKKPSPTHNNKIKIFTEAEEVVSFYFQNVYKKIAIVLAGPVANFILAIFLLTAIFKISGIQQTLPIISNVVDSSPAKIAGMLPNDEILKINDKEINSFKNIITLISIYGHKKLSFTIKRDNKVITIDVLPKIKERKDIFNNEVKTPYIGINADKITKEELDIFSSFHIATIKTYEVSINILAVLYQFATGQKDVKELGGPLKIAKYSGQSMNMGFMMTIYFIAIISINLGVINLLPIPTLDGGHLFFYIIEVIRGRPLPEKLKDYSFRFGMILILMVMGFTIFNDIFSIFINKL